MALKILRGILEDINKSVSYAIMADVVTNVASNEQFVICFRSIDHLLEVFEDFIGLYQVNKIKAETLVKATGDILLRLSIPLENACTQCSGYANSMVVIKSGTP